MKISKIRKRDGRIVKFDQSKITNAIHKAMISVKAGNGRVAKNISNKVVKLLEKRFKRKIPNVENVQDIVEEVLIKNNFKEVAKVYILYRKKRTEIREAKKFLGVKDELKLTVNAINVLQRRYLLRNNKGEIIESPTEMFRRVAKAIAKVDKKYRKNPKKAERDFYNMMANLEFLPNSPTLMNAGTELGQLSACFVLPVEDSIKSIYNAVRDMALIQQSGGGTGFSFSRLRPKGDIVRTTHGIASGPVSFMRVFDVATDVIKQGGKRRGANMGILRVDHPDVMEFITAKNKESFLNNFNLSVAVTENFMKAVKKDKEYNLINPRIKKPVLKLKAKDVFNLIISMAWKKGDPGIVFIDEVNKYNPTPKLGEIESTNPCGEQPLLPYESCNLGSINLSKMINKNKIDWKKLKRIVHNAVHFLDNVIDANKYPLKQVERMTKGNRKIGLGVMGFADMLIQLGIPYDSEKAIKTAEEVMKFISKEAKKASIQLAKERRAFPNFRKSIYKKKIRNATITTIAPTGTISIIAGCSSGIEPLFAISFVRNVMEGTQLLEVNPLFEKIAKEKGFYSTELMMKIAKKGSIKNIKEIPKNIRKLFVTAHDISPEYHVKIQAAFQKYTDNAVSKTVNLPHTATIDEVKKVFLLAYKLKCKGVTVYRYGSKKEQVLNIGEVTGDEYVSADAEYAGGCPTPYCPWS
ncbi:MAG: vitamin B12-dependent ribonucleotide reductase [Candidatus Aenigmatarchaeota archaeon]